MLNSKKDFADCFIKIASPALKYFTRESAGLKCGNTAVTYGEEVARTEGFMRLFWGFAPFFAGGGENKEFEKKFIEGIANGTNPKSPEYWGEIGNKDQRLVECAPFGVALALAPEKVWEPLNEEQKQNLYNWLNRANKVQNINNNWQFFTVMVNIGLKNIGMPYDKENIQSAISKIHSFYKGNGWYSDGLSDQMDYYISFAIHFYSLIYARLMEKDDPENSRIFKERAMKFAKDFIYWFDRDGAAIAFGRSLTYRFAQCCFWSACVFADIRPFPLGVMKGIISRHLDWWLQKPIFDNDGILTIGYAYPNLYMSEGYNGFGSPAWAFKSFLILALADNHEFFVAEALPLPQLEKIHIIPEARMVIQHINGYAVMLTSGQWAGFEPTHTSEKYSKFAYSSKYAFCVPKSYYRLENAGTDNMLTFVKDGICFVRRKCTEYKINPDGSIYSKWSPFEEVVVETYLYPTDKGHRRKHIINSQKPCTAYECGFSADNDGGDVLGLGERIEISRLCNLNLIHPYTKIKALKYDIPKGESIFEAEIIYPE